MSGFLLQKQTEILKKCQKVKVVDKDAAKADNVYMNGALDNCVITQPIEANICGEDNSHVETSVEKIPCTSLVDKGVLYLQ